MALNESLLKELKIEAAASRKMLERIPEDKYDWKPHEKSMSMGSLAAHIAENLDWAALIVNTDDFNFETSGYKSPKVKTKTELLNLFDDGLNKAVESLKNADDKKLHGHWIMRSNEKVFIDSPRMEVLRSFFFSHSAHHRGQLSVYMRMNDILLPQVYGPTADDTNF
ncbi:MAG: hypothetical protein HGGPFJEG_01538 [Ignavibacteria bacterium]|nr:hypothetical protein [Ignavibacteria bacterium]